MLRSHVDLQGTDFPHFSSHFVVSLAYRQDALKCRANHAQPGEIGRFVGDDRRALRDSFGAGSQCSAEVVLPNMPLRGWATSTLQFGDRVVHARPVTENRLLDADLVRSQGFAQLRPRYRDNPRLEPMTAFDDISPAPGIT
jgi:hypothetical protein